MSRHLRVGRQSYDLGSQIVVDGFFASITYRLEPDGRGTRFPTVMNRLYAGHLSAAEAPVASRELEEIESRLANLTLDRAVWSLSDLRRRDDSLLPVNRSARHLGEYFVAGDGRPLLAALKEAVQLSLSRNQPVVLASSEARKHSRAAFKLLITGLVWSVVGYVFFRDWILTSSYDSHDPSGPLIWPLGILIFASGLASLIAVRHPAIADWFDRRVWLTVVFVFLALGVYMVVTWRS